VDDPRDPELDEPDEWSPLGVPPEVIPDGLEEEPRVPALVPLMPELAPPVSVLDEAPVFWPV
jgi:hypothetical protein